MRRSTRLKPDPATLKLRRVDYLARKPRKRRRHCTPLQLASIRIIELTRLFKARYGEYRAMPALPNDDAGRDAAMIVAHHLARLADARQRITDWCEQCCPWMKAADLVAIRNDALTSPRRWTADKLAWRLHLTYANRTTLKITTIGSIDVSRAQRIAIRKRRAKQRAKASRERRKVAQPCAP